MTRTAEQGRDDAACRYVYGRTVLLYIRQQDLFYWY